MSKNFIKEIIIILLLCLAIILLLGILLYEYVPMNKTLPNTEAYTTPSNVKSELKEEDANGDLIQTYEINSSDLDDYKRIQNYKPGKADPFSSYESSENGNGNAGTNTTINNSAGNNSNNTTVNGTNGHIDKNTSTRGNTTSNTTTNNNSQTNDNVITNDNSTSSGGHFYKDRETK